MNTVIIDGVKVVNYNGKLEFHIPTSMNGVSFVKWKEKNKDKIDKFKDN